MIFYTTHYRRRDAKLEPLSQSDIHRLANGGATMQLYRDPPIKDAVEFERLTPGWRCSIIKVEFTEVFPELGTPGVRDPENPCAEFTPLPSGKPSSGCEGDGHYLCMSCKHYNQDLPDANEEEA